MAKEASLFQEVDLTGGELPVGLIHHLLGREKQNPDLGLVRDGSRVLLRCCLDREEVERSE